MIEGQPIVPTLDLHKFRGQFLDSFALIENHIAPAIGRLVAMGLAKKVPHLFGQKFELIKRNLDAQTLWRNRDHVRPIIEELAPLAALRGIIGHGLIEPATLTEGKALSISPPGVSDWSQRKVLTVEECLGLLRNLDGLTSKLLKQRIFAAAEGES